MKLRVEGVCRRLIPSAGDKDQSQGALGTASAATVGLMHPLSRDDSMCSDTSSSQWGGDWGQAGSAWSGRRFALEAHQTYRKFSGQHDKPQKFWVVLLGPSKVCVGDRGISVPAEGAERMPRLREQSGRDWCCSSAPVWVGRDLKVVPTPFHGQGQLLFPGRDNFLAVTARLCPQGCSSQQHCLPGHSTAPPKLQTRGTTTSAQGASTASGLTHPLLFRFNCFPHFQPDLEHLKTKLPSKISPFQAAGRETQNRSQMENQGLAM